MRVCLLVNGPSCCCTVAVCPELARLAGLGDSGFNRDAKTVSRVQAAITQQLERKRSTSLLSRLLLVSPPPDALS